MNEVFSMKTIMLDGSLYATGKDLHQALKQMLSLPDYYGMNADALNDCLSERAAVRPPTRFRSSAPLWKTTAAK